MPRLAGATPAGTSGLDCPGIVAVKKIRASRIGSNVFGFNTIDKYQHRRAVRVLVAVTEPDRLHRGVPIARRTVRQEGCLVISPQCRVEVFDALQRSCFDDNPITLGPGPLE